MLAPWTDPTGDFVKLFRGLLKNEVDMIGIEIVALDSLPEPVVYKTDIPPAASSSNRKSRQGPECTKGHMYKKKLF